MQKLIPIKVKNFEESCFWHFPIIIGKTHEDFQNYLLKKGYDVVGYGLKLCNELGSFNNYYKKLIEAKNIHDNTYFLPLFDDMSKKDTIKVAKAINNYFETK